MCISMARKDQRLYPLQGGHADGEASPTFKEYGPVPQPGASEAQSHAENTKKAVLSLNTQKVCIQLYMKIPYASLETQNHNKK